MRILIVGCGYVGIETGRRLAGAGHDVHGLRRTTAASGELIAAGIKPAFGDITRPETYSEFPVGVDAIINTVSSSRGGAAEYREVYLEGTRRLIDWASTQPLKKYLHASSTSVYAQADGSLVDEDSPATPPGETGRLLRDTEDLLLAAHRNSGLPSVILRIAGIYGPGRGHLFQQFLRGEARLAGDGGRFLNMVHRDDVAEAFVAALDRSPIGTVFNVVDDTSVTQREFLDWVGSQLGLPLPPAQDPSELIGRKRGLTHKRVSNHKIRGTLGWAPRYPSFREGYRDAIDEARRLTRLQKPA